MAEIQPMTTQKVNALTIWYMHCIIIDIDNLIPFADTWNIRTGFTYDTTQSDIAKALLGNKVTKEQCLGAWREFCHMCLDDISAT